MYNTPHIRNGGFGALQVEAVTNRPMSIARRHTAASQLRMRDIEPDELSSSQWVRFLVMEASERERWMMEFTRLRRNSNESSSSAATDRDIGTQESKAEEARQEAEDGAAVREELSPPSPPAAVVPSSSSSTTTAVVGSTPSVSIWARIFDETLEEADVPFRRPRYARRTVTDGIVEAPPTYETAVRARTPPPAYRPRGDEDRPVSPMSPPRVRFDV